MSVFERQRPLRLTYGRLIALVLGIWACVFLLALLISKLPETPTAYDSPVEMALASYETYDFATAEHLLVQYLREHPDDREALEILLHHRLLYNGGTFSLNEEQLAGLIASSPHAAQMRYFRERGANADWPASKAELQQPGHSRLDAGTFLALAELADERRLPERALWLYRHTLNTIPADIDAADREWYQERAHVGVLNVLTDLGWYTEFKTEMDRAEVAQHAEDFHVYIDHLKNGRYLAMIPPLIQHESGQYETHWVLAGLGSGFCWLVWVLHLARFRQWPQRALLLAVGALILGAASAYGTIIVLLITEEYIPLSQLEPTFLNEMIHMVLGVGLREELVKLICFLPLVPFLRRMPEHIVLAIACLVGLGFAVEENVFYYTDYGGSAIVARFLTANFLHMALTGFGGYYLVLAVQRGGEAWSDFFAQFVLIVILHGAYDFLLGDHMGAGGFLATIVLVWLSYQFLLLFISLDRSNTTLPRRVPVTYVFVGSMALLTGIGFLMMSMELTAALAAQAILFELINVATISVVFFVAFREPVG